jgi:3-isopropylmalate/(R)-2-methylmalate dehydratase small subunit
MEAFTTLRAVALPLPQANIDTDQILPSRYIQKPRSSPFGEYLFRDLRLRKDGSENAGFALNQPAYRAARIVVAGDNFACGSSREHAVWALYDHGFRVAIATSFGEIFYSNALKNGFLPVVLPAHAVAALIKTAQDEPGAEIGVDLIAQTVTAPDGSVHDFAIDFFSRHCLLQGIDEIEFTLRQIDKIELFEATHAAP